MDPATEIRRVLLVEDLPSDAELCEREIRKALGPCEFRRVETREDFLAALDAFRPTLIISDFKLPQFDGLSALRLAVERAPDVPFLVLTGSMNEDTAVECMKAGAWDYVIKEHVKRLGPAVQNVLEQKRVRRERMIAEAALRKSEQRLREAQRLGRMGHWEYDLETRQIQWSDAVFAIYRRDPALGPPTDDEEATFYSPEDARRLRACAKKTIETGEPYEAEVAVRLPGGEVVGVFVTGSPVRDSRGRITGLLGTAQDITARKRIETALRQSESLNRGLVEHLPHRIFVKDRESVYLACNANYARDLGIAPGEIAGKDDFAFYPREMAEGYRADDRAVIATGTSKDIEERYQVGGEDRWVRTIKVPYRDAAGALVGVLGIFEDVTGRKRAEEQVARGVARLRALHEIDRAIASSVDHRVTLGILLDRTLALLGVDAADVLLLTPHAPVLGFAAGAGFRTGVPRSAHVRMGEGLAGRVALDRRTLVVEDLTRSDEPPTRAALFRQEGFVTYVGVPLLVKGRVGGVLETFLRHAFRPDDEWTEFLEALAGQAAIALDNALLVENLQRSNVDLSLAYDTTIEGWSRALDLRDKETEGHSLRVTETTIQLARSLGLSESDLVHARRGALLHDIGKVGIPDAILLKPGRLTDGEWVIMRRHPTLAFELLAPIAHLRAALDIPYCHHEKWDGTGYPRGLKGEEIPFVARIFAVVDVWDALRSDRPYRRGWPDDKIRDHIASLSGTHFDPKVAETFLAMEWSRFGGG